MDPYAWALIRRLLPDITADVLVDGLSGLTAVDLVQKLGTRSIRDAVDRTGKGLRLALREDGPFDLVIIMLGTNDLGDDEDPGVIAKSVRTLHEVCHKEGVKTVALSVPANAATIMSERYLRNWTELNSLLCAWANGLDGSKLACFIDTNELVPYALENGLWEPDTLHLSPMGSRTLGEGIAARIAPLFIS